MDREGSISNNSFNYYNKTHCEGELGKGLTLQESKEEGEGKAEG